MSKVKIISDPYRRHTEFLFWDQDWQAITEVSNPNSDLLQKKFTEGFFPFKAREIVDAFLSEYGGDSEALEIIFEGPDDEWIELQDACDSDDIRGKVSLDRSVNVLANARDILPFIREVFDEVYPIIAGQADGSAETIDRLRKFREASSDVVPICVVGNYSAGKSSFINSLMGVEILPSGDRPITARIFQIERSDQPDRASIKFKYADETIHISFLEDETKIDPRNAAGRLIDNIREAEADGRCRSIADRVRAVLEAINFFKEQRDEPSVSDLVKVTVPFAEETSWGIGKKTVIFDTPGSNSNSNVDHTRVLQDAMRGMSDGLPIYVTIYDSLDSNDNADLYKVISEIPALDERFAMIVVNKADDADLPEGGFSGHEEWIMETVVARNLYAQGIFFVSSIAGLGAKTGGEFADRHYDRVFRRLRDSFEDPDDKYYLRLFDYDLMPSQLRVKLAREAERCPNTILANSGLYSVERGIDAFATKYSAYNKCLQSQALLHELIVQTEAFLVEKSATLENSRDLLRTDLLTRRENLLDGLIQLSLTTCEEAVSAYLPSMNEWARRSIAESGLTPAMLQEWEHEITARKQREMNAEEKRRDAESKRAAITTNLRSRVQNAWDTKDVLGFRAIAMSFVSDVNAAREAETESDLTFRDADRQASDDLLEFVRSKFDTDVERLSRESEEYSKGYWTERANACRSKLLDFITDGDALSDAQRETLRRIIIGYEDLSLDEDNPVIREIRYPFDPNKLWKAPLRIQYNMELSQRVSMWRAVVEPAHEERFRDWLHALVDELVENIEDINPELRSKVESVRSTEREIEMQQARRIRLRDGEKRVTDYMAWQEG